MRFTSYSIGPGNRQYTEVLVMRKKTERLKIAMVSTGLISPSRSDVFIILQHTNVQNNTVTQASYSKYRKIIQYMKENIC